MQKSSSGGRKRQGKCHARASREMARAPLLKWHLQGYRA